MIRDLNLWETRWALTLASPSTLLDGLTVAESDFGLWRPRYDRHAYRNLAFSRTRWSSFAETGTRPDESGFPSPLAPTDDQPPYSVITRVAPAATAGKIVVEGVSADDGTIRRVAVNGVAVQPLRPDYSRWRVELDASAASALVAQAEDAAGHREAAAKPGAGHP
ncbi:MAG: hypothetical protein U0794_23105 [Isosphaeraceae bacterium]